VALEIHRWRSTTGDPLLGASWDSGVAPGIAAQADLTFTAVAVNNETVTIAGIVYTFKTSINNGVAREVFHGATATDSATNLAAAINAGAGAGTAYSSATVAHKLVASAMNGVIASNPSGTVVRASSNPLGADPNGLVTVSETSTVASWSAGSLSGGVTNWASDAIILFDGVTDFDCQGTDRLDGIRFVLLQTEDAEHDIGTSSTPFRWNQYADGAAEHRLEGGGNVYLAHGATIITLSAYRFFTVRRLPQGYLEFQKDPGILDVKSGVVSIVQTTGSDLGSIILDGLDANVTVVSGKLTRILSRNGRFISNTVNTSDTAAAIWNVLGGVVESLTPIGEGSTVFVDGGVLRLRPLTVPAMNYAPDFHVSGGILDLSESVVEVQGHLILMPGGTVWGGLAAPQDSFVLTP